MFSTDSERSAGVVVLTRPELGSMWNPTILELVERLEVLLDGAHVVHATAGDGGPTLGSALAAVRFAGGGRAIVVAESDAPADLVEAAIDTAGTSGPAIPFEVIRGPLDADAIVDLLASSATAVGTRAA